MKILFQQYWAISTLMPEIDVNLISYFLRWSRNMPYSVVHYAHALLATFPRKTVPVCRIQSSRDWHWVRDWFKKTDWATIHIRPCFKLDGYWEAPESALGEDENCFGAGEANVVCLGGGHVARVWPMRDVGNDCWWAGRKCDEKRYWMPLHPDADVQLARL